MANKIKASTQKFTEIHDILEDIIILEGNQACLVIEIQATNFALLSNEEQQVKIYAYASLLNSLSFPIQILIRNKKLDISSYLKKIDLEIQKTGQNEKLISYMKNYKDFVLQMVKVNIVLDKNFYIVIPFSSLELGAKNVIKKGDFEEQAKASLHTKANTLLTQLSRLGLRAKILEKEMLIRLFYEIYNHEQEITGHKEKETTIIKGRI